ncbi:MAG: Gfo/Idh/MocA family oxidoreductase [Oscillospiraceae bacterium]|nr:Gfo/Idh/MocA family oxidoreductase [Oscillospiraceae bacterium]
MKKKFVIVGTSSRGLSSYGRPLTETAKESSSFEQFGYGGETADRAEITDASELVGGYDINIGRAKYVARELGVPAYEDFDKMLEEQKPDCIIVTTTDNAHAEYIVRGLDKGYEVWTEKPMCITAEQCRAILEAEKRNNRKIGVCFNMRYMNNILQIKEIIDSGVLGEIYNVNFEWLLSKDYTAGHSGHGASYYRRWNAYMEKSGGLLLTKSTHHFDMINWLINGRPKRVSAFGRLREYGKNGTFRGERCSKCEHTEKCKYYYKLSDFNQKMFVNNEHYDGYIIDRCVYDEAIDTYDTMSLNVEYTNGVLMSYSESSAAMYEGFKLFINGSDARLEVQSFQSGGVRSNEHPDYIRIIKPGPEDENITVIEKAPTLSGGHGGADDAMRRVLFLGEEPEFECQKAGAVDGAYSILIGAAANESIKTGKIIDIDEFIGDATLLDR